MVIPALSSTSSVRQTSSASANAAAGARGAVETADVLVVGGGRWARVLIDVLCGILAPRVPLRVCSPGNAQGMLAWARTRRAGAPLEISAALPNAPAGAVIVANAAHDHEATAEWALRAGSPTLVEKPVATTAAAAQRLLDLARAHRVTLAASHVFLFAPYVQRFAERVAASSPVEALTLRWADPLAEHRYGEVKSYDARVPVFADWLPHVVPLVGALLGRAPDRLRGVTVARGGAAVGLDLRADDVPCTIFLERNTGERRRLVEVRARSGRVLQLDFSAEPAVIRDGERASAEPMPASDAERPLARMLATFLAAAAGAALDPRLSFETAVRACRLSDEVAVGYRRELATSLGGDADKPPQDADIRYALAESGHRTMPELMRTLAT
ncbi:MAG TPA: Gfo/Idh/MocA family oxidoreductase [Burkholderiales bacterium]|nr:Gfo/Idh/MocA family oxidoreductase [Burkholderiales bacterium]